MRKPKKIRLCTRVSPDLHAKLVSVGKRDGVSQANVVEAALHGFFSFERDDQRDASIIRRLDRLTRQFSRLERNDLVLSETVSLLTRFLFTVTPQLPQDDFAAAQAVAEKRFDDFVERLAQDLAKGRRVLQAALNDVVPDIDEFATLDEADGERASSNGGGGAHV